MKAYIKPDKGNSAWLIVERGDKSPEVEAILGMFRDEDNSDNVAYPILADEIEAIMLACKNYLEEK